MKNTPAESKYVTLVADIGRLYEGAQQALVDAYWRIGRRIVEVEQGGSVRAQYGDRLLERLSSDLSTQYGAGFSADNLERMRNFYLTHPISAAPRKLAWTQYVELLSVDDDEARGTLERRAETEGLSSRELRELVHEGQTTQEVTSRRATPLRRPTNLKLHTCRLAAAVGVSVQPGHILIDCGFGVYRSIPETTHGFHLTDKPSYTYQTIVERVVDGDTVWGFVDVGFGTVVRLKLRLHGINAAEVNTVQGDAARDYVARFLPPGAAIVIRAYASDAFGRYLADIFCPEQPILTPSPKAFDQMLTSGIFLNQDLLTKRLAVRTIL
jgi:endonuclease YncB( thermonuclease family)